MKTIAMSIMSVLALALYGYGQAQAVGSAKENDSIDNIEQVSNDYSQLSKDASDQLVQLAAKYKTIDLTGGDKSGAAPVIEMGDNKVVRIGQENLWYQQEKLKGVHYRDDAGSGYDLTFFDNGGINSYVEYKNGIVAGTFAKFYANGKLRCCMENPDGKAAGIARQWDNDGAFLGSNTVMSSLQYIANMSTNE